MTHQKKRRRHTRAPAPSAAIMSAPPDEEGPPAEFDDVPLWASLVPVAVHVSGAVLLLALTPEPWAAAPRLLADLTEAARVCCAQWARRRDLRRRRS
ncbi:hypothetical protein ACGFX2_18005 [Streptomyces goshikiensis]|uniref:hypothetical protein n=1 Tax=Streptomyces goshikiensis TaxID=1942 RepID=UPI0037107356